MFWEDNIFEEFLDPPGIKRMFTHLANSETRMHERRLKGAVTQHPLQSRSAPSQSQVQRQLHSGSETAMKSSQMGVTKRVSQSAAGSKSKTPLPAQSPIIDPISNLIVTFINRPIALVLNEVGVMPFKDRPLLIFPYNLMTNRQKDFLRQCVARVAEWTICNDNLVFDRTSTSRHIAPVRVITTMCDCVLHGNTRHDHKTRIGLCNIILQRVRSRIPIDTNVHKEVNEWVARFASAPEATEKETEKHI